MIKIHFESPINLNGPTSRVADSKEDTVEWEVKRNWEVSSVAPGDGCSTVLIYLAENITCT